MAEKALVAVLSDEQDTPSAAIHFSASPPVHMSCQTTLYTKTKLDRLGCRMMNIMVTKSI